jgi:hypothetical protein
MDCEMVSQKKLSEKRPRHISYMAWSICVFPVPFDPIIRFFWERENSECE